MNDKFEDGDEKKHTHTECNESQRCCVFDGE